MSPFHQVVSQNLKTGKRQENIKKAQQELRQQRISKIIDEKEKVNLASTSVSLQVAALAMMDKVILDSKTEYKRR